jgi:hypothetical protein
VRETKYQGTKHVGVNHKSVSYRTATEWGDETIGMRIKPILVKRQSKWSVSGLWRKIAIGIYVSIDSKSPYRNTFTPLFRNKGKDKLRRICNKHKRTETISDNLSRYVIIQLNGDCLNRNALNGYEVQTSENSARQRSSHSSQVR